jgi:UDP-N-acetyl-D-mannosaminuronate dehydrogenase
MIEKGRQAGFDHEFLKLARKINSNMPIYTVKPASECIEPTGHAHAGCQSGCLWLVLQSQHWRCSREPFIGRDQEIED